MRRGSLVSPLTPRTAGEMRNVIRWLTVPGGGSRVKPWDAGQLASRDIRPTNQRLLPISSRCALRARRTVRVNQRRRVSAVQTASTLIIRSYPRFSSPFLRLPIHVPSGFLASLREPENSKTFPRVRGAKIGYGEGMKTSFPPPIVFCRRPLLLVLC